MTQCAVTILNPLGLHARAAARFVHAASGFACRVTVGRGEREVDGKSIMGLLLLAASQGSEITISADGPDEDAAIAALCALIERGLDEYDFLAGDQRYKRELSNAERELVWASLVRHRPRPVLIAAGRQLRRIWRRAAPRRRR